MSTRFKRRLSDEERAARREAERQLAQDAAQQLLTSEGWQAWLRVRSQTALRRYSLLISGPVVADGSRLGRAVGDMSPTAGQGGAPVLRSVSAGCQRRGAGVDERDDDRGGQDEREKGLNYPRHTRSPEP